MIGIALSQQSSTRDTWQPLLQDAYSAHLSRVQAMLPPHSGLPALLDLTQSNPDESGKYRAWETWFESTMGTREITDLGVSGPSEATSIATTFIDTVGGPSALPARSFLDIGKQYFLFIWKPSRTKTYMIAEPYLIQDGLVFPIKTEADVSAYENGMPVQQFEAKVTSAIAKNIDID